MKLKPSLFIFLLCTTLFLPASAQMGRLISVDTLLNSQAGAAAIRGNYLYLHNTDRMLDVYTLTNPASPTLVNEVEVGYGHWGSLGQFEDKLFMYDVGFDYLRMIDISSPANPVFTDSLAMTDNANALQGPFMAHTATHTYVAYGDTLFVVNHTDSSNLFLETKMPAPQFGGFGYGELVVFDTTLYVSNGSAVQVFNISNPALPDYWTAFNPNSIPGPVLSNTWRLEINREDTLLYLGDWITGNGHQAFDIRDPLFPQFIWRGTGASTNSDLRLQGNLMVQRLAQAGVAAFFTNADSSQIQDTLACSMSPFMYDLDLHNNYIYLTNPAGLEVIYFDTSLVSAAGLEGMAVEFTVYPNPATDFINVQMGAPEPGMRLELWNLQGQLLQEVEVEMHNAETQFDLRDLPRGSYWLDLRQEGRSLGGKMVVRQ